jgi:hypothetical protein
MEGTGGERISGPLKSLLGDADVSATMVYTHWLNRNHLGARRPVDRL